MKIQMHLFCLIGALATGITDGRISSSSSSSSSKSVGGSAVDVTPLNRRELEPAIEYCTAIDRIDGDGKQRGVVDWQGIDQCHKCEGGQPWWPCDSNLCIGSCTPEAVCDERLKVAAAKAAAEAAAAATATAPEDTTTMMLDNDLLRTTNDSLRGELEKLKAEKESLEESIVRKDAFIAELSLLGNSACMIDCVDGYERGTDVTCTEACAGPLVD